MARRSVLPVTVDNLPNIPDSCRKCGYWESADPAALGVASAGAARRKADWYRSVLADWGPGGKILVEGDQTLAYASYAPPHHLPQIRYCDLGVDPDAVFLACLYVAREHRGRGLGKSLVNSIEKDLLKKGYKAIETVARSASARNPSGWTEFYLTNGWQLVRQSGPLFLLRIDLRTVVTWQVNLDSVLGGLTVPRPAKAPMAG
jgi:GNAT superfamily N-acetyltransferase